MSDHSPDAPRPAIYMRGALAIDLSREPNMRWLQHTLTLKVRGYRNSPDRTVYVYRHDEPYLLVPRYFRKANYWPRVERWDWVAPPLATPFAHNMTLREERGQPAAVEAMVAHIQQHSSGVLVAPTGYGKTLLSLEIARRFNTPIGIMVYVDHMRENWLEHIERHLGVPPDQVGHCQGKRCDVGKAVTLLSVQSLVDHDYPPEFFNSIGFLIFDETHKYAAPAWHTVLARFPARYRLGMSADPRRFDGLGPLIEWCFGEVGYAIQKRQMSVHAAVYQIAYQAANYYPRAYCDFVRDEEGNTGIGDPNPERYDKCLMRDKARNKWLVSLIVQARRKMRSILIFTRHRDHAVALHAMFQAEAQTAGFPATEAACMLGGARTKAEKAAASAALKADVLFTTYAYARDAMNATQLDTLLFGSPPGNPLQPMGRLRDVPVEGKKDLMILDPYEPQIPHSREQAEKRAGMYKGLGHPVHQKVAKDHNQS